MLTMIMAHALALALAIRHCGNMTLVLVSLLRWWWCGFVSDTDERVAVRGGAG